MKEATGDLSMTAVAVVAIAAVAVVFTTLIWPSIKLNILNSTKCAQAHYCAPAVDGVSDCEYLDEDGKNQSVRCPDREGSNSKGVSTSGGGGYVPGDNFQEQDHMQ